jgi:hypothetical protein
LHRWAPANNVQQGGLLTEVSFFESYPYVIKRIVISFTRISSIQLRKVYTIPFPHPLLQSDQSVHAG